MNRNYAQHRQGFTLIEVLIVIGIIAVLVSILALGGKAVMNTVKGDSAKTALRTMANLQTEYEASAGRIDDDTIFISDRNVRADQLSTASAEVFKDPNTIERDFHAMYTQRVLRQLYRNSKVKAAITKMSPDSIVAVDVNWVDADSFTNAQKYSASRMPFIYLPGDVVRIFDASSKTQWKYYVCKTRHSNSEGPPPGNTKWRSLGETNPNTVYVPRDAWGNPLRYAGTLGSDRLKVDVNNTKMWYGPDIEDPAESSYADNAAPDRIPSDPAYHALWLPLKTGSTPVHWIKRRMTAPSYTSFWISAGPDGDFETNDDNVYSFEN